MSNIDFILLYSLLFGAFALIPLKRQSYIDKNYWNFLSIFILLFTFIIGLRYGWGNDYLSYKFRMEHPSLDEDAFYGLTNKILQGIGFNYVMTYMLYAFLLVTGAFKFIKNYPHNKYMLALFLPAMFFIGTSTIRQGFATSIFLFGLAFLYEKKWIKMFFAFLIAYSIHTAILIPMALFAGFYALSLVWKKPLPIIIILPLYIIIALSTDAASLWFVNQFSNSFDWLSNFGQFESYSNQSSYWFGEEGISDVYVQTTFALIMSILFHSAYIYVGYKAIKLEGVPRNILYLYNSTIVGLFILRIGMLLEIIHRIGDTMFAFYFVPLGFAISAYRYKWKQLSKNDRYFFLVSIIVILAYLAMFYGRFIFMSPKYGFVWNFIYN